ncbi:MAG: PhzF family phenazine biosynthesis protein [Planktotalea sp.]|uniref:PhzF family phenazine biosynthesis protein n=1 Tax=Planktotalea sp. TaxID=2029877 RepID=UPI003C73E928
MSEFAFHWVDAFTDRPFGGNGCAVVHNGAHLDDETCTSFVKETSLIECTFLGPSETADLHVRYFLASREIPFAGHPTVASVIAAHAAGTIGTGDLTLETLAGIIPVHLSDDGTRVTMRQNAPIFGPVAEAGLVAAAIGLREEDIIAPPQLVSTGLPFIIVPLSDRVALGCARLNAAAIGTLNDSLGPDSVDVMEPFLTTLGGFTDAGDTFSRLLLLPPSSPEDPFTGSATGAMGAYMWQHGLIETPDFTAEQGHTMGRPGAAKVRVLGPRDAIEGVEVAGNGHILMSGSLHL